MRRSFIFDRVRENIGVMKPKKATYKDIVNLSINQTFSRTIYTSLTTFVTIFVLYIMGVASIKESLSYLLAGVVIGAYSSSMYHRSTLVLHEDKAW